MRRMAMCIKLKEEKIDEYLALHRDAWPDLLAKIAECNIRNYSIYLKRPENILFGYWEYHGKDFAVDAKLMAADPTTQRWWKLTDPCQEPFETRKEGEWWAEMEEAFHTD
jgi:L-rhamnose mutarotase